MFFLQEINDIVLWSKLLNDMLFFINLVKNSLNLEKILIKMMSFGRQEKKFLQSIEFYQERSVFYQLLREGILVFVYSFLNIELPFL